MSAGASTAATASAIAWVTQAFAYTVPSDSRPPAGAPAANAANRATAMTVRAAFLWLVFMAVSSSSVGLVFEENVAPMRGIGPHAQAGMSAGRPRDSQFGHYLALAFLRSALSSNQSRIAVISS